MLPRRFALNRLTWALAAAGLATLAACSNTSTNSAREESPQDIEAPGTFRVRMETSKGPIVIECNRSWAPRGVDRFHMLVKRGYYDQARFFRVVPGFVVQFGMHANPEQNALWSNNSIPDDPVQQPNRRGTLAFAAAGPNTRTTQIFINLVDNSSKLDPQGFAVFGRIVEGLELIDQLNAEYGERPEQQLIALNGNAYLIENFPKLDYIQKMTVVE